MVEKCKQMTKGSGFTKQCQNEALLEGYCMGHYWKSREEERETDAYMKLRYGERDDRGLIC